MISIFQPATVGNKILTEADRNGRWFDRSQVRRLDPAINTFLDDYYRFCTRRQRRDTRKQTRAGK